MSSSSPSPPTASPSPLSSSPLSSSPLSPPSSSNGIGAIVASSKLADLANTRMSTTIAQYYTDSAPQAATASFNAHVTYGLMLTKQDMAPPEGLVDVESRLNNRYDILGKSGYVYRDSGNEPTDHVGQRGVADIASIHPMTSAPSSNYFEAISGRDFSSFSKKSCQQHNFWRDDLVT
eukprot:6175982-Pleurochrysis_carterae.AAC.1